MRKLTLLAVVLGTASIASHAGATTLAECLAAQVTPEMQKDIVARYLADGPAGIGKMTLPKAADFAPKCLPSGQAATSADIGRVSTILAGYWMKFGAEASLAQRHGVTAAQLDAAWRGLRPELRARFARGGKADEQSTEAMTALLFAVRPQARLDQLADGEKSPLLLLLTDLTEYGIGRGMFETPDLFEPN